jgi:ankyrin repeat protein
MTRTFFAVAGGACVVLLLRAGPEEDARLWNAVREGNKELVAQALTQGAQHSSRDDQGDFPLLFASGEGFLDIAQALVAAGADPLVRSKDGSTAVGVAALANNWDIVRFFVDQGAPVNEKHAARGGPLLHLALEECDAPMITYLLDKGASLTSSGRGGATSLHVAVKTGDAAVVDLLLARGAGALVGDKAGKTPFFLAVKQKTAKELVSVFLKHGVAINTRDAKGRTIVFEACLENKSKLVKYLAQQGADLAVIDKAGKTLLEEVMVYGNIKLARFLLVHGAPLGGDSWVVAVARVYEKLASRPERLEKIKSLDDLAALLGVLLGDELIDALLLRDCPTSKAILALLKVTMLPDDYRKLLTRLSELAKKYQHAAFEKRLNQA